MSSGNVPKYVGEQIKKFRLQKGITQQELAEYLNTTSQTISRYENGILEANQTILFSLADYFNISINDFFPPITENNNSKSDNIYDKTQVLFDKTKNILSDSDRDIIEHIMIRTIEKYEKSKNKE